MTRKFVAGLVDKLGVELARLADLELYVKQLKDELKEEGVGAYEGELFRATVSDSVREHLDMKAVRAKLSAQFIAAHTTESHTTTVRVVARNGVLAKAAA